jgi:hypothetical protein
MIAENPFPDSFGPDDFHEDDRKDLKRLDALISTELPPATESGHAPPTGGKKPGSGFDLETVLTINTIGMDLPRLNDDPNLSPDARAARYILNEADVIALQKRLSNPPRRWAGWLEGQVQRENAEDTQHWEYTPSESLDRPNQDTDPNTDAEAPDTQPEDE